jgi:hypothetical protein
VSGATEATRTLTITIPMAPPSALSPNQRSKRGGHWQREGAVRELRFAAYAAAGDWLYDHPGSVMNVPVHPYRVRVHEHVIWPKSKGTLPDPDAIATYCKAALDGIVDAGIIAGDSHNHIASVTTSQEKGTDQYGRIEITITEVS